MSTKRLPKGTRICGIDPATKGPVGWCVLIDIEDKGLYYIKDMGEFKPPPALKDTTDAIVRKTRGTKIVYCEESHYRFKYTQDVFQRLFGMLNYVLDKKIKYIWVKKIKKFFGKSKKEDVAKEVLNYLDTPSTRRLKRAIKNEEYNATDAVSIAICGNEMVKNGQRLK